MWKWNLCCFLMFLGAACQPCVAAETAAVAERSITVASLMIEPVKWDKDANCRRLEARIREARQRGARLVVTPEGAIEGYVENEVIYATGEARRRLTERFNAVAEPCDGARIKHFAKLCKELDVYLVLGFLEVDGDKRYNTAILINPEGRIAGKYRKTHFAQGHSNGEKKGDNPPGYFRGTDYPTFDVDGWKLGIMICFDRRVPKVARRLVEAGAQFIVNPAYGMAGDCNRRYLSARSKENGVPIVFAHPKQTVFSTADGTIKTDVRPKRDEDRICVVSVEPAGKKQADAPR